MPAATISQLQSECESWKRFLSFIMEENIHLKNRISKILSAKCEINLLANLEVFQTEFIGTDTLVALLRNDVQEFETKLRTANSPDFTIDNHIARSLQRMRRNIDAASSTFSLRQIAFNDYLSHNIEEASVQ